MQQRRTRNTPAKEGKEVEGRMSLREKEECARKRNNNNNNMAAGSSTTTWATAQYRDSTKNKTTGMGPDGFTATTATGVDEDGPSFKALATVAAAAAAADTNDNANTAAPTGAPPRPHDSSGNVVVGLDDLDTTTAATTTTALTPVVRDACLKAMQLFEEKESFQLFYLFCQTTWQHHNNNSNNSSNSSSSSSDPSSSFTSPGTVLALALLYTRLFVAFSHRHQKQQQQQPPTHRTFSSRLSSSQKTINSSTATIRPSVHKNNNNNRTRTIQDDADDDDDVVVVETNHQSEETRTTTRTMPTSSFLDVFASNSAMVDDNQKAQNMIHIIRNSKNQKPMHGATKTTTTTTSASNNKNNPGSSKSSSRNPQEALQPPPQQQQQQTQPTTVPSGVGKVQIKRQFEAISTNVELSPKVSDSIFRIANDLSTIHDLLPSTTMTTTNNNNNNNTTPALSDSSHALSLSWTDWSVASICVIAYDFVMESLEQVQLQMAWNVVWQQLQQQRRQQDNGTTTTSNNNNNNNSTTSTAQKEALEKERNMFFIFCEKTTQWIAGRLVRCVEAYQDFLVLWSKAIIITNTTNTTTITNNKSQLGRLGWNQSTKLDLTLLKWEPEVPGTRNNDDGGGGRREGTMSTTKSSKTAKSSSSSSSSTLEKARRTRIVLWKLTVFFSLFQQQQQAQRIPSRRQRLIASAAAFAFVMGLHKLVIVLNDETKANETEPDSNNKNNNNKTRINKKEQDLSTVEQQQQVQQGLSLFDHHQKRSGQEKNCGNNLIDLLVDASNQECAFTRWACTMIDDRRMEDNITSQEIIQNTLMLATSVQAFSQSRQQIQQPIQQQQQGYGNKRIKDKMVLSSYWLKELYNRVGQEPHILLWNLPTLATELVDTFSRQLRQEKMRVEASFFYDEIAIVKAEQHDHYYMEILCNFLDRPPTHVATTMMEQGNNNNSCSSNDDDNNKKKNNNNSNNNTWNKEQDPRFTAIAAAIVIDDDDQENENERNTYNHHMAEQPYKLEQTIANKRRKLWSNDDCTTSNKNSSNNNYFLFKATTPTVITQSMELTEWTIALLSLQNVQPSTKLRQLLRRHGTSSSSSNSSSSSSDDDDDDESSEQVVWTYVIPILNSTLLRLSQEGLMGKTTRKSAVSVLDWKQGGKERVGTVVLAPGGSSSSSSSGTSGGGTSSSSGVVVTHDKALCRAIVACYYHTLECILDLQKKRQESSSLPTLCHNLLLVRCKDDDDNDDDDDIVVDILDEGFHRALLTCCTMFVIKAVGTTHKLRPSPDITSIQTYQVLLICDSNPYELLKYSQLIVRAISLSVPTTSTTTTTTTTANDNSNRNQPSLDKKKQKKRDGQSPVLPELPQILKRDLQRSEASLLEALVWAQDPKFGTTLPRCLEDMNYRTGVGNIVWWPVQALYPSLSEEVMDTEHQPCRLQSKSSVHYPTSDTYAVGYVEYKTVSTIIEKVLRRSYQRIVALCEALDIPSTSPLANHVFITFRFLMRTRIDLFFDRHVDHWILCCLYGVAKQIKLQPEILFVKIVDAYIAVRGPELGTVICQRIIRNIRILGRTDAIIIQNPNHHHHGSRSNSGGPNTTTSVPGSTTNNNDSHHVMGNVIMLYNKVFVPAMKDYLLHSKSLQKAALEARETIRFSISTDATPTTA